MLKISGAIYAEENIDACQENIHFYGQYNLQFGS